MHSSPVPFAINDSRGFFRYVNKSLASLLGLTPLKMMGRPDEDFLAMPDVCSLQDAVRFCIDQGQVRHCKVVLPTTKGRRGYTLTLFPLAPGICDDMEPCGGSAGSQEGNPPCQGDAVALLAYPIEEALENKETVNTVGRGAAPSPAARLATLAKKRTRVRTTHLAESLRRSRQAERAMLDATSDLVLLYDVDGVILQVNQAYSERIGIPRWNLVGRKLVEVLPPERIRTRYADTRKVLETGVPKRGIAVYERQWEEYVLYPLMDKEGIPDRFVLFIRDVTDTKRRELELRKLRAAIEHAGVVMVVVDEKGSVEYVNSQYTKLTGLQREDVQGRKYTMLRPWRLGPTKRMALRRAVQSGQDWHDEVQYRRRSGPDVWLDCSVTPVVRTPNGDRLFVLVGKDITERKKLEEIREGAERVVRHNLKSPLNTILNSMYLLENCGELNPEQQEFLTLGNEACRRVLRQLRMSMTLFRMEAGTYDFAGEPVDVVEMLDSALQAAVVRAERIGVELALVVNGNAQERSPLWLRAEPECLACLVDNLLYNALEASRPGQRVEVAVDKVESSQGEELSLRFSNPTVVPEAIRSSFFEKYATYGKRNGTGLGTYSARLITVSMHGRIYMNSCPATGTCVEVRFPLLARSH